MAKRLVSKPNSNPNQAQIEATMADFMGPDHLDLPWSIMLEIFGRLPLQTLAICRYVCKSWQSLLKEPYFSKLYAIRSVSSVILHVKFAGISDLRRIYLIGAGAGVRSIGFRSISIGRDDDESPNFEFQIGNSCNGLVCLRDKRSREPLVIWNPVLGQYSWVPGSGGVWGIRVLSGFGYDPRSNRYKLVRVFQEGLGWGAEVFQLGLINSRWRRIRDDPNRNVNLIAVQTLIPGFYINNCIHWIVDDSSIDCSGLDLIYCFDFVKERFGLVPGPPISKTDQRRNYHWSNLGVLGGYLSICAIDAKVFRPDVQVWVMEEYGLPESWVIRISIRDPVVDWWDPYRWMQVTNFAMNGEILILCGHRYVLAYDPRERKFKDIKEMDFDGIAYVPSFVSLEEVLREDGDRSSAFAIQYL